ncbi:hypothetical protein FRB99_003494 [Tulasnella sp. 403]|nr:hypothetical protein FRB99_003494 [Tulasnella sp. 403]
MAQPHIRLDSPVFIIVCVAAGVILFLALFAIVRCATRKPSAQLPPPQTTFVSSYWNTHFKPPQPTHNHSGSAVFVTSDPKYAYGWTHPHGAAFPSDSSQVSLFHSAASEGGGYDGGTTSSGHGMSKTTLTVDQDNPMDKLRHAPSISSPLTASKSSPGLQPVSHTNLQPNASLSVSSIPSSTAKEAAVLPSDAADGKATPFPSASDKPLPDRPENLAPPSPSRNQHSITPRAVFPQPPVSGFDPVAHRRQSRLSMYSIAGSVQSFDPRRASAIRGAPHKTNMQIVLPEPLAAASNHAGMNAIGGNPGNSNSGFNRRQSHRASRVDLWTESHAQRTRYASMNFSEAGTKPRREPGFDDVPRHSESVPSHLTYAPPPSGFPLRSNTPISSASGSRQPPSPKKVSPWSEATLGPQPVQKEQPPLPQEEETLNRPAPIANTTDIVTPDKLPV